MALDPISAGFEFGKSLVGYLGKWIADPDKAQEAAVEIQGMATGVIQGQIALNAQESQSPSLFVSGWRPGVGWVCLFGLGYQIVFRPIVQSIIMFWKPDYAMVQLELDTLLTLLSGILGLGVFRTIEKYTGVSK